jgi:2-(1,2-epoxy-1,2-dihydrophenyl)acetyl-CoA isomerase
MDSRPSLLVDRDGCVLTLTINRPDRGNALDPPTMAALIETFDGLAVEPGDVRAVRIRSEGKHFCTGADIAGTGSSQQQGRKPAIGHMVRGLGHGPHRLIEVVWSCRLPVVAELTGRTSGLGLHLALSCDLTIAAETATFAEPFSQRGFSVDSGGSWLLPRFVGLTRAKQLLYTAEPIDAPTALEWGLVSEVAPDQDVADRANARAQQLGAGPTFTLGVTKQLLHQHLLSPLDQALAGEAAAIELTIRSDDFKEGMRAFIEKRSPDFTGS